MTIRKKPIPWHRRDDESEHAWAAFQSYLEQRSPRSLDRVHAEGYAVSRAASSAFLEMYDWQFRVTAYDNHLQHVRDQEAQAVAKYSSADRAVDNEHLVATGAAILRRELSKILAACHATEGPGLLKPEVVLKAIPEFIRISRLLAGEATSIDGAADYDDLSLEQLKRIEEAVRAEKKATKKK
jgi:hypothetical protein